MPWRLGQRRRGSDMRLGHLVLGFVLFCVLGGCAKPEPFPPPSAAPPPAPPPMLGAARAQAATKTVEILYGTDRARSGTAPLFYGDRRGPTVEVGVCLVAVDTAWKPNFVESLTTRWFGVDRSLDPFKLVTIKPEDPEDFWRRAGEVLKNADAPDSMILYVHGYNTTFEDAARRAAQLSVDLDMPGHVAMFSWPSRGSTEDYTFDEATIDASEWALQDFMVRLARTAGPGKLHVIAHSMGNRAFLRAMERAINEAADRNDVRFGQIILAAPDVDSMVFNHLAPLLARPGRDGRPIAAATTVYVARNDEPLWFSRTLHDAPRAGRPPPLPLASGVTIVDIQSPRRGVLDLGHSDYATVEPVVRDIKSLIRLGQPSAIRRRSPDGSSFVLAAGP
jgi:esterase/lipase superfamily enzyme